jgi:hypothetical protein
MQIGCGHGLLYFGSLRTFLFLRGADLLDTEAPLPPSRTVLLLRSRCCCCGCGRRYRLGNDRQGRGVLTRGFVFLKRRDIFV